MASSTTISGRRYQLSLTRLLTCVATFAIGFALVLSLIASLGQEGLSDRTCFFASAVMASMGGTIGVIRSGMQGLVLGGIAGLVIGTLSPAFVLLVYFSI